MNFSNRFFRICVHVLWIHNSYFVVKKMVMKCFWYRNRYYGEKIYLITNQCKNRHNWEKNTVLFQSFLLLICCLLWYTILPSSLTISSSLISLTISKYNFRLWNRPVTCYFDSTLAIKYFSRGYKNLSSLSYQHTKEVVYKHIMKSTIKGIGSKEIHKKKFPY